MTTRKCLGMGLDVLLSSADRRANRLNDRLDIALVRLTFNKALDEDEKGNMFEAYYLYRRVIDKMEEFPLSTVPELCRMVSQALNNAAIILFESGDVAKAHDLLVKAVNICPDNHTASENLKSLTKGEKE